MNQILNLFATAAQDSPIRETVQVIDGCWQVIISGKVKWQATCAALCVPADAEQVIDGETLTIRWPSYADQIFGDDGLMAQRLPSYEPRSGQLHMARVVQRAIEMGEPAVIEAETGVGKSFAYAAVCMAMNKTVVIATSNKALQMQLYTKDIPFLQSLFPGKTMALAQGKGNYACLERCQNGVDDQRFAQWLQATETGSVEELSFHLPNVSDYTVNDECTGKSCSFYANCFYFAEKAKRQEADVIICNHSLLAINHLYPQANILPGVDVVVVDEAHQLPNFVRNTLGWEYQANKVRKALNRAWEKDSVFIGEAENLLFDLDHEVVQFISQFRDKQITIPDNHEFESGRKLAKELRNIANEIFPIDADAIDAKGKKKCRRASAMRVLADQIRCISQVTRDGHVRWIDVDAPSIVDAPHNVSRFIRSMVEHTFDVYVGEDEYDGEENAEPVEGQPVFIFASATLATPKLSNFKLECGIDGGFELIAESPFDYANNALLYVPNGSTPPPSNKAYLSYLIEEIKGIVSSSNGGVFLLFTSWYNMNKCLEELRSIFEQRFSVYVQGELPKLEIAKRFKEDGNAVLFATKSFWEGVDVPGDALRTVIIDKMPFSAPTPLYKAREAESDNPFMKVMLPEMIIDLKQGVGRLVRNATDKGVIAILDSRIRSKPYGRNVVLKSLPPAKLIHSTATISEFFNDHFAKAPDLSQITVQSEPNEVEDFTLVF